MNFDIIDNDDSFSTLVEKEQQALIENKEKKERKCAITNVAIPGGLIVIFIIIFICCNKYNKDNCGCEFASDVSSNAVSGTEYMYCVYDNYMCYDDIVYK